MEKHFLLLVMDLTAWSFLVASWVVPRFIKDNDKKSAFGLVTSSIALGIFIGSGIVRWCM